MTLRDVKASVAAEMAAAKGILGRKLAVCVGKSRPRSPGRA